MPENSQPLIEGEDYIMEGPYMVFTAAWHLKRGYCCESGCRNCPWRTPGMIPPKKPDTP